MFDGFMLGIIVATSWTAGLFFLKFWRRTHDFLFLAFSIAFTVEGLNRLMFLTVRHPNEGSPSIYIIRFFSFLLVLYAIVRKNLGGRAKGTGT